MDQPSAGALTRRELLMALTGGAVAAGLATGACGGPRAHPGARAGAAGRDRAYLRGINCYTLNYVAGTGRDDRGEPAASYRYLAARGHRIVRLPFEWGHVQPRLGGPLDRSFVRAIDSEVAAIADAGMRAIIDLHSSCRYPLALRSRLRFAAGISERDFNDVWLRLSDRFAGDRRIHAYDLMNEPFDLPDDVWQAFSQAAVAALRARGDHTRVWIEGNEWSLTGTWRRHQPRPWIDDPADRIVYSAHSYPGQTGQWAQRSPLGSDARTFVTDLADFVAWLDEFHCRGSIGEVGWPSAWSVGAARAREWNRLGDAWYTLADDSRLDVTYFGASSAYDNWLWAYDGNPNAVPAPGLTRAHSQAAVIEAHPSG
jgi:endoglucanase